MVQPLTNLNEVRSFLGFTSYYRKFIPNYSSEAIPLTKLTKKNTVFHWGGEEQTAFDNLRNALLQIPMLHYVQQDLPFQLAVDASNYAIGGVLRQVNPATGETFTLAFASKTLCASRSSYCATKRELYAVIYFMRYFQGYTRGHPVEILTDHAALQWLLNFKGTDNMYYRWIAELESYQPYTIKHVPGKDHVDADALSRIRRICGYEDCPHCLQWRQKNRKCRGSDSEDSVTDSLNHIARLRPRSKPPEPEEVWLKMVPDRPDLGDYASYDLALIRQEYCNDQYNFAVTRAQAKGDQKPLKMPVQYRQKVREVKPQGAVRMLARLKNKISHEIIEPPVVLPKQVDNPVKKNKA